MPTLTCVSPSPPFKTTSTSALSCGLRFVELTTSLPLGLAKREVAPVSPGSLGKKKKIDLFKHPNIEDVSLYDVLGGLEFTVTPEEVKKAYHQACLIYHPDKTGLTEDDPVFLSVKKAFDTLSNPEKKRTYDSSANFDDSIPPADLKERKFYAMFGECFVRNQRFAVIKEAKKTNRRKSNSGKNATPPVDPNYCPPFGDDNTPIEQVNQFYQYWINFESWRDFTLAASKKCDHDVEGAEGREEKRWMMNEISSTCKKMKKAEVKRISDLLERSMNLDPRLRREKERAAAEKEEKAGREEREKREKEETEKREKEEAEKSAAEEELERKTKAANMKAVKDKEKKMLRKQKNLFRKLAMKAFETGGDDNWGSLVEANDEVEFLIEKLDLMTLPALSAALGNSEETLDTNGIKIVRGAFKSTKSGAENAFLVEEREKIKRADEAKAKEEADKAARAPRPWSAAELNALHKAVKKNPVGGGGKWEIIANYINQTLALPLPRSKDECLKEWNAICKKNAEMAEEKFKGADEDEAGETAKEEKVDDPNAWSADEVADLQKALKKFNSKMEKNERWTQIARFVATKNKKMCVDKYKEIRASLKK
ncbi:hypothetical protein TrLO_g5942 [Triparma laevis f. longispina]|uniref:DnaJ homolog subfamily C member 2 n=1 Tax=Triparma laevis f. longispina TaxID=1714387 RepID=A0A9W7AXU1_9STRA|nr:hypothetical protein TrLO_g5942 [Triparma laevis f. longispina]